MQCHRCILGRLELAQECSPEAEKLGPGERGNFEARGRDVVNKLLVIVDGVLAHSMRGLVHNVQDTYSTSSLGMGVAFYVAWKFNEPFEVPGNGTVLDFMFDADDTTEQACKGC